MMLVGALAMVHYYGPMASEGLPADDLEKRVHELTAEVERLKQEQSMPAVVLDRYRNSIGYIYGVYQVGFPNFCPTYVPGFPGLDSWSAMGWLPPTGTWRSPGTEIRRQRS